MLPRESRFTSSMSPGGNPATMGEPEPSLHALALAYGIQLHFYDVRGRRYDASEEALLALLPRLGAELETPADIPHAIAARSRALTTRILDDVHVAWDGALQAVPIQLPAAGDHGTVQITLNLESGEMVTSHAVVDALPVLGTWTTGGSSFVRRALPLGTPLPLGYHRLELELGSERHDTLIIAAPQRAFVAHDRRWGVFAPTYALRSNVDHGIGTLAELSALWTLANMYGARYVGTLPLNSVFLRELFNPSPYAPVSRLFWNEVYLQLEATPEYAQSESARAYLTSSEFTHQVEALRASDLANYQPQAALMRTAGEHLMRTAFDPARPSHGELQAAVERDQRLADYARFLATVERRNAPFHVWPDRLRNGQLEAGDYDEENFRYHVYMQVRMRQQLEALSAQTKAQGGGLYLDMPLGVHPDGYDAWRFSDCFLDGVSTGAPPDALFSGGQDWGFRPLHPGNLRARRYDYMIESLRNQFRYAGALRIDHVMGLHRLFCIPHGFENAQGVYLEYPANELYAILTLESQRHQCLLIGEDLGTVPDAVRESMTTHDLHRMYVMQFSFTEDPGQAVAPPPPAASVSINTHDTPTFAAFWTGQDIEQRVHLKHTLPEDAEHEHASRARMRGAVVDYLRTHHFMGAADGPSDVLGGALNCAASSDARLLIVNLEDLWQETNPQNIPGTTSEHPNWRRRAQHHIEELEKVPGLTDTLREIQRRRNG